MSTHNLCICGKIRKICGYPILSVVFLHTYVWVLIRIPWRGTSNEYPQDMFSWKNKKDMWLPTLICSYFPHTHKKNIFWVLVRNASARCFQWVPKYMFSWKVKKDIMWIAPLIYSYNFIFLLSTVHLGTFVNNTNKLHWTILLYCIVM